MELVQIETSETLMAMVLMLSSFSCVYHMFIVV